MIHPQKLVRGDTIGIISPSAWLCPIFPHRVENWVKMLEQLGFNVKFAHNAKNNAWYVSWSIQERVDDIHEMFEDTSVKAIICSIWGNHSNQLLKHLDFNLIENNPKIFIGYSDITILHYALLKKANLQTFYWPCLISEFGEYPEMLKYSTHYFLEATSQSWPITVEKIDYYTDELLNWINKEDLTRSRKLLPIEGFKWLKEWNTEGQIIWWCIPSVNHLIGTEYRIEVKDKIFFIDIPEGHEMGKGLNIADLDAYLTDLDNIGVFDDIVGLLVSVPYWYSEDEKEELEQLIIRFVKDKHYPVGTNFPIGHTDPMITLPLLSQIKINTKDSTFIVNT